MTIEGLTVIVPSYNGRHLLEVNLPPLLEAFKVTSFPTEVVIVDDCSTDGITAFKAERHPQVVCFTLPFNVGCVEAKNAGLARARYPLVYILDNDITVMKGFLEPLVAHFTGRINLTLSFL
jgi:glycosyltransferase involved in cell wall biosynthesis